MKLPGWIERVWSPKSDVRTPTSRRQSLADLLWWLGLTVPVLLLMIDPQNLTFTWWAPVVVAFGNAVALKLRRGVPVAALLTVVTMATWSILATVDPVSPWQPMLVITLVVLSYLVGRADDSALPLIVQFGAICGLLLLLVPLLGAALMDGVLLTMFLVFAIVFPWLVGRYRYQHALLLSNGWERAKQLEREQRAVAEQVRLRERTRIAEDMHDSLGHELSLIALRAAALEVDSQLPPRHQEAAGQLRQSAAVATERLREIIGLLRDETESATVTPVDESIGDLIERARESGLDIAFQVAGETVPLPHMADRAAHRVVQEALTNVAKHAPGCGVSVRIEPGDNHSTITVVNDLPADGAKAGIGGGRGLVGLTERVRLAGGSLRSGKVAGRFEVVARLPHSAEDVVPGASEVDTESGQEHVQVRRQTRRRLITVFAIPIVLLTALGVVSVSMYLVSSLGSVLPPDRYEKLYIGQSRESVEEYLPTFGMLYPPTWADPTGPAECVYYPSRNELDTEADVYQLCFVDDRLVVKNTITVQEKEDHYFENRNG